MCMVARAGCACGRIFLVTMFALLTERSALGYRREYSVTWEGQRKPNSEVCIYRAVRTDAFSIFFSDPDVTCLPADKVLDFPPGLFNAYARHRDGYVSSYRDFTVFPDPPRPETGYELLEIPLERAAYVDFSDVLKSLPAGDALGVWLAPSPTRASTYFPLVRGETSVLVPTDRIVMPLHIHRQVPVAVGEAVALGPAEHVKANFAVLGRTVVAWIDYDRQAASGAEGLPDSPDVLLNTHGRIIRPVVPLFDPDATGTLMIYRDVPVGPAEIFVRGMMWRPSRVAVSVDESPTIVVLPSVKLIAAGAVRVEMAHDARQEPLTPCEAGEGNAPPRLTAHLLSCATPTECKAAPPAGTISSFSDHVQFEGLEPGAYRVVMRPPIGKLAWVNVNVRAGRLTTASVSFPETLRFFGTVTINGRPAAARLIFATGETHSNDNGEYTAELPADPLTNLIQIIPCSTKRELRFVPQAPIRPNERYDITLAVRSIPVHVVDSHGGDIANAEAWYGLVKPSDPAGASENRSFWYTSQRQQADAHGTLTFEDVPMRAGDAVLVCARREGYVSDLRRACVDGPSLNDADTPVTITLAALRLHGKVLGHQGLGELAFVAQTGVIIERASLANDGIFSLKTRHEQPEYIVYVSAARPLTVASIPVEWGPGGDDLQLSIPLASPRSFTASADRADQSGYVGVWIGSAYVPLEVLAVHQDFRGHDVRIEKGKSVQIVDLAQTAPISAAFAPDADIPNGPAFVDPFTLPQFAGVHRISVTSPQIVLSSR